MTKNPIIVHLICDELFEVNFVTDVWKFETYFIGPVISSSIYSGNSLSSSLSLSSGTVLERLSSGRGDEMAGGKNVCSPVIPTLKKYLFVKLKFYNYCLR